MDKINVKNKYIFYKFNTKTVSTIAKGINKKELIENMKDKKISDNYDVLLMKIEKKKEWTPKIPINMLGGPIKVSFSFYTVTNKGKLKKQEDSRGIQIIYYTLDYYQKNKIKSEDLKKIALLAFLNKLEKRLLAPKLITQINNS
jgi:hypothetical protein